MRRTFKTLTRHPIAAAVITGLFATPAAAVYAQDSGTTELDKITVTGSRIARTGFVTPSPVTAISAEEIRTSGALNIGDLMNKMPQLVPSYSLGNSTRFEGKLSAGSYGQLDAVGNFAVPLSDTRMTCASASCSA